MKADGTLYREGSYVVRGFDDILPQFGKIEAIVVVSGEPLLILLCVKTKGLCSHFCFFCWNVITRTATTRPSIYLNWLTIIHYISITHIVKLIITPTFV